MTPTYYTFEELRALGCPDGLLMQYVTFTKKEINKMLFGRNK